MDNISDDTQDVGTAQSSDEHNDTGLQVQETDPEMVRRVCGELGLELPDWLVENLAKSFNGMMPMKRFLADTCEVEAKLHSMQSECLALNGGATYQPPTEGKNVKDGMEANQKI
jgi:hypothetical protein